MVNRKWHLEHADGSHWTYEELDGLLDNVGWRLPSAPRVPLRDVLIDDRGRVSLVDESGDRYPAFTKKDRDMFVVFDGRKWCVTHKGRDRREWTQDELHDLRIPYGDGDVSTDMCALDSYGSPLLLNTVVGAWCYADDATDDMEVAWGA